VAGLLQCDLTVWDGVREALTHRRVSLYNDATLRVDNAMDEGQHLPSRGGSTRRSGRRPWPVVSGGLLPRRWSTQ